MLSTFLFVYESIMFFLSCIFAAFNFVSIWWWVSWSLSFISGCFDWSVPVIDVLVWTMLKGTVKCDICCELQISVNQNDSQCILCSWDIPVSAPSSVCEIIYYSDWFEKCKLLWFFIQTLMLEYLTKYWRQCIAF